MIWLCEWTFSHNVGYHCEYRIITPDTFELYAISGSKSLRPILYDLNLYKGLIMSIKRVIAKNPMNITKESGKLTSSKYGFPQENLHVIKSGFPT